MEKTMKKFDYETLKRIVKTKNGRAYIAEIERVYSEKHAGKPISALSFRSYEKYFKDGDRKTYEKPYFERRNRLYLLQALALAKPKYTAELEDVLAAICDEYTWVLPAHAYVPVDLFCAETGASLAKTVYIFKDRLSPHLLDRIEKTIERQVFVPYETKKSWWESGNTNNWGAVCACGVGLTYMYMSSERFERVKSRLFDTFKCYIEHGLDEDGYCSEGAGYWQYGFGRFCEFFDDYVRLYGNRPEFVDSPKLRKTLAYANNARMQKDVYLPFADGGYRHFRFDIHTCASVKGLYGKAFAIPPCKLGLDGTYSSSSLSFLFNLELAYEKSDEDEQETSVYYENAQVFIRKRKNYAFAAKCGNNDEFHNHNDVGSFQIVKDGKRYICDVGCGEYTKDYFGPKRYEYFVCSANAHSIPIVDGTIQREGKQYCGKVVSWNENEIVMDLSSAYPNFGGQLLVTYTTRENAVEAHYLCKGLSSGVTFRFLSDIKPKMKKDGLYVADMKIVCKQGLEPLLSVEKYSSHLHAGGKKAEAYIIDYKAEKSGDTEADFVFELKK